MPRLKNSNSTWEHTMLETPRLRSRQLTRSSLLPALALSLCMSAPAKAYRWDLANGDVQLNFDTTLSFGVQLRTEDPNPRNFGRDNGGNVPTQGPLGELLHGPGGGAAANPDFNFLNGDNGDLNYRSGDLTSAALKGTHELGVKWGEGWSALGRATWLYDGVVADTRFTKLSSAAKDIAELNFTPLDLWVAKDSLVVSVSEILICACAATLIPSVSRPMMATGSINLCLMISSIPSPIILLSKPQSE